MPPPRRPPPPRSMIIEDLEEHVDDGAKTTLHPQGQPLPWLTEEARPQMTFPGAPAPAPAPQPVRAGWGRGAILGIVIVLGLAAGFTARLAIALAQR
jgi:hypothetical protein